MVGDSFTSFSLQVNYSGSMPTTACSVTCNPHHSPSLNLLKRKGANLQVIVKIIIQLQKVFDFTKRHKYND